MASEASAALKQFQWEPQPAAQKLINELMADFLARCPDAQALAARMKSDTGTRFADWVDHIETPASDAIRARLKEVGFTAHPQPGRPDTHIHEGAMFPAVVLAPGPLRITIKVDSVADFLAAWRLDHPVEGEPGSHYRRARAFSGADAELWIAERHGYRGFEIHPSDPARLLRGAQHLEALRRRRRDFGIGPDADRQGFAHATALIDAAINDLGRDWACDLFFQAERDYWQRRNRAARVQKARQDALGLGWANHDHHTYRSSRHTFPWLIAFMEKLGFHCRERFYAGHEADWGAQVIEQPVTGITIFADVDMTPQELMGDFAHQGFAQQMPRLGTVGMWCFLHGEAFLQAGMHHLECQFDWHALKDQLEREASIRTMDPFTTFPFLRQAFTEGERWPVAEARIAAALHAGHINEMQAAQFRAGGALGSHLENLERNNGYKGFNQQGVSQIISKTDPRMNMALVGA
ncbi:MAG: hypothetical protein IT436_19105 [Phycisphaerales bacterium]|nr:hypothetical protein [Phycisphaerales bacterium]